MKFHPDKNSAPSAEAAFKAINTAVEILSDSNKREIYDQTGHEGYNRHGGDGAGGGGGGGMNGHMSPEDIFQAFFHEAAFGNGRGFQMHFGGPGGFRTARRRQAGQDEQPANPMRNWGTLFQLLPMLLLFLLSFMSMQSNSGFGGGGESLYSLSPQGKHTILRKTSVSGITRDIPYYVDDEFFKKYSRSQIDIRRLERMVENDFKTKLVNNCHYQVDYRNRMMAQARQRFYKTLADRREAESKAAEISTAACDEYNRYFNNDSW